MKLKFDLIAERSGTYDINAATEQEPLPPDNTHILYQIYPNQHDAPAIGYVHMEGDGPYYEYEIRTLFRVTIPEGTTSGALSFKLIQGGTSSARQIGLYQIDGVVEDHLCPIHYLGGVQATHMLCTWNERDPGVSWSAPGGDYLSEPAGTATGPWPANSIVTVNFSSFAAAHAGEQVYLLLKPISPKIWTLRGRALNGDGELDETVSPFIFS